VRVFRFRAWADQSLGDKLHALRLMLNVKRRIIGDILSLIVRVNPTSLTSLVGERNVSYCALLREIR